MRKVSSILLMILALAAFTLIAACTLPMDSDDADGELTLTEKAEFEVIGSSSGIVQDPQGNPIVGATVAFATGARALVTVKTNEFGLFEMANLVPGRHYATVSNPSAKGYTAATFFVDIPTLAEISGNADLAATTTVTIDKFGKYYVHVEPMMEGDGDYPNPVFTLFPKTAKIYGVANYRTLDESYRLVDALVPAGWVIGVRFQGVQPEVYEVKVGAAGVFTIPDVPATWPVGADFTWHLVSMDSTTTAAKEYKIDDGGFQVSDDSSQTEYPELREGQTVNAGSLLFIAAIAPKVIATNPVADDSSVTFDPGNTTTRTPLVLTFSKAMNPNRGTITVANSPLNYVVVPTWNTTNTILTLTPTLPFEFGATVTVTLAGFESADAVALAELATDVDLNSTCEVPFYVDPALGLVSSSVNSPYSFAPISDISISHTILLGFNRDLAAVTDYPNGIEINKTYLKDKTAGTRVEAAITVTGGDTLSINPATDLMYNTDYQVFFEVTDGQTVASKGYESTPAPLEFTTVMSPTLATAISDLGFDTFRNASSDFDNATATVSVQFTKGAAGTTYSSQYRLVDTDYWSAPAALSITGFGSTLAYADIGIGSGVISGETTSVRILSFAADSAVPVVSNELDVTDQVAPTGASITTAFAAGTFDNAGGATDLRKFMVVDLGDEPMDVPIVAALSGGATTRIEMNGTEATIWVRVPAGNSTTDGQTLSIRFFDAAGNENDEDSATNGAQPLEILLP